MDWFLQEKRKDKWVSMRENNSSLSLSPTLTHSHVLWSARCGLQGRVKARLAAHAAAVAAETVNLSSAGVIRSDAPRRVKGVLLIDIIIIPVPEDNQPQVSYIHRCHAPQWHKRDGTWWRWGSRPVGRHTAGHRRHRLPAEKTGTDTGGPPHRHSKHPAEPPDSPATHIIHITDYSFDFNSRRNRWIG